PLRGGPPPGDPWRFAALPGREPSRGHRNPESCEGTRARRQPYLPRAGRHQSGRGPRPRAPPDPGPGSALDRAHRRADRPGNARQDARTRLMLTRRGRVIFALGFGIYVAAWAFGSKPLYPVATGLLLVVGVAWAWVRLSDRPFRVKRGWGDREHVEGDDVPVVAELHPTGNVLPASVTLSERVGRLGEQRHVLRRNGRRLSVRYVLEKVPRGRYAFQEVHAELADPFGLEQAIVHLPAPGALLVYPRLVRLGPLFTESGTRSHDGQRLLLRRHSGFELHSVRDYEQGESLRRVHWPSTARRGQLMVKELEDSPRDEIAVLLDADAKAVVGES